MVRLPANHLVHHVQKHETRENWSSLQAAGQMLDPRNTTRWKHPRPGSLHMWEDAYCELMGESWRNFTHDRQLWRSVASSVAWLRFEDLLGRSNKLVSTSPEFATREQLRSHLQTSEPNVLAVE
eukprot:5266141-Karenia_brevis.AAC.1